jgi:hypothetical protein
MFRRKMMMMGLASAAAGLFVAAAFAATETRAGRAYLVAALEDSGTADRLVRDIRASEQIARTSSSSSRSGRSSRSGHSSHSSHSHGGHSSRGGRRSRSSQNVTMLAMSLQGARDRPRE